MNKNIYKTLLVFVVAFLFITTCKKTDQELIGQIHGTIKNSNNQPIENVILKIDATPSEIVVFSKADGTYAFNNLKPQAYQILASKEGYITKYQNVTLFGRETKTLDFSLINSVTKFTISTPTIHTNWYINTEQTINWEYPNEIGLVKIELLKSGSVICPIDISTENNGSYVWTIPSDLTTATDYKIRITCLTTTTVLDESDDFTITVPEITLPTVSTSIVSITSFSSATSGGNVNSDGGATVIARGVCWSTSKNPTITDFKTTNGMGLGTFTSSITELTENVTYYIRAYATSSFGTAYGKEKNISIDPATLFTIGNTYQGGIIAYIFQPDDPGYVNGQTNGLIVAKENQGEAIPWYNGIFTITTASATELGTGFENTIAIISNQGSIGEYAAKLCRDYRGGNYSDWFLPSKDELNKLYLNKDAIGGFIYKYFWSSSERGNQYVWTQNLGDGNQRFHHKEALNFVRAVRFFSSSENSN